MRLKISFEDFLSAYNGLDIQPFEKYHKPSPRSRIVHDLGISGDDFDDLVLAIGAESLNDLAVRNLKKYIPEEVSRDSYYIAMARSWVGKYSSPVRQHYLNKITTPSLEVSEFLRTFEKQQA